MLELDSFGYNGPIRKTVQVITNDPLKEKIRLSISADIKPIFDAKPTDILFLLTEVGKPVKESMVLKSALNHPVEVVDMTHDLTMTDDVKVKLEPVEKGYRLTVSTKAKQESNQYGLITLTLQNAPVKTYAIRADVIVEGQAPN